jgi:UDP-N-acetylmuramate dehydrogenase
MFTKRRQSGLLEHMGSMFATRQVIAGRLIEAAGLKGKSVGGAEISSRHANFFINNGNATARYPCVGLDGAGNAVEAKFGVKLDLENRVGGDFQAWLLRHQEPTTRLLKDWDDG